MAEKRLSVYLMAFPDTPALAEAAVAGGADLMEIGFPFSDPLADGPVIHAAGTRALRNGATLRGVIAAATRIAERVPVVLMCYANLIYARGAERFADELSDAGISGLIVPDLPLEEAAAIREACDEASLALVPLIAPTTPADRLAEIARGARGFIYAVSLTGTTGEREGVHESLADTVSRAKRVSPVPVAVGFGISTPEQAAAAAATGADGVIVGSRLVRAAAEAADAGQPPAPAVGDLVATLADALRR